MEPTFASLIELSCDPRLKLRENLWDLPQFGAALGTVDHRDLGQGATDLESAGAALGAARNGFVLPRTHQRIRDQSA